MKNYFLLLLTIFAVSCSSNEAYEDLNKNPNAPSEVSDNQLFVSATNSLTDFVESTNVNVNNFRLYAQYWTQTQYTDESNYEMQNREIPDYMFSEFYRDVLGDLKNASAQTTDGVKIAQIELLSVYAWQMLVDAFGDVPYSEALLAEGDDAVLSPKYDSASGIYTDLISRAESALSGLSGAGSGYVSDDLIFSGSISSWTKFGNSLLVKLGSRLLDVNSSVAKSLIENHYSSGISSNVDNANIAFQGAPPNTNPLWEDLVQSGRQDFIPADTFVEVLNSLNDPRADKFFDPTSKIDIDTTAVVNLQYQGGPYGVSTPFNDNSHISQTLYSPEFRGVLMDYAEMSFILAEAANRGYSVGGTAEEHYQNGVKASMDEWGVSTADSDAYLAHADVAFASAPGTAKEKIAKQFWISMYNRGFEGWTVYRLFDAPTLKNSGTLDLPVPKRYTYPQSEQTINGANVKAANGGNDTQQTPIFWDN
jgi:hypothetical protein